jgi:hypothetical protein
MKRNRKKEVGREAENEGMDVREIGRVERKQRH